MRAEEEAREEAERLAAEAEAKRVRDEIEHERKMRLGVLEAMIDVLLDPEYERDRDVHKDNLVRIRNLLSTTMPQDEAERRLVAAVNEITDERRRRKRSMAARIRQELLGRSDVGIGVPNTCVTPALKNAMTPERIADPHECNADPVRHRDAGSVPMVTVSSGESVTVTLPRYDVSGVIELPEAVSDDADDEDRGDQSDDGANDDGRHRRWLYDHEEALAEEAEAIAFGLRPEPVIHDDDPDAEAYLRAHLGLDENGRVK